MFIPRRSLRFLPPAILAVSLSAVYLRTLSPGLTWANNGADGGDLVTAAATGGVPHPTGYPLYILLARLFQFLPFGSLAWRTNLLSVLAAVVAALILYALVARLAAPSENESAWLPGLLSGFAFGLSPLFWSQAVITEVYTLQALFVTLILYLCLLTFPAEWESRLDGLRGLVLGLALGSHLTNLLFLPVVLVSSRSRSSTVRALAFLALGSLVYLVLPLRALANPPVNWGNPVTPARFWWLISGRLYQEELLLPNALDLWRQLQLWAVLFLRQFGVPGLLAGITGFVFFTPSRARPILSYTFLAFSGFMIAYTSLDSYIYLIPAFLTFAIWIGLCAAGIMHLVPRFNRAIPLALLLSILVPAALHWHEVDASHDTRAEDFGAYIMREAPPKAILFAEGDRAVFSLWYFHLALRQRPDLAIIAADLLHFDWYQETLRSLYPALTIRGPFPWPETIISLNLSRPACFVEYTEEASITCP